ncbi:high affinity copper uptake protein 1-like isoform X2 [Physella acuta]|nr:high affinity copper uptake protein 1-like isoform X2 [Physella acuta]XP_059151809.1 high affinity copper uptake protein 1-like isoform X2 [Physella acuta]XP_059151810.1 high affinity copper uptake protein 1-like isoform X2 [Physella acuta]XP_059151811.1 high affinity copper uptake protein 1-like isoform X2 [Physella acuta]
MNHDHHNMMDSTTAMGHNHGGMEATTMDHSGHNMDHSGHNMGGMDMMQMYFHVGSMEYVLFESCMTQSDGAMVGACFVIFFVAILYEGLKFVREWLLQRSLASASYVDQKLPASSSHEHMVMRTQNSSIANRMLSQGHLVQTVLHVIQVFVSYCLMLVFMTYNVWLCLAVVLGAGVGYFCFGWKRAVVVDSNEHCH